MARTTDRRAWELVSSHCDIAERLRVVPAQAKIRGMYCRSVLNVLEQNGKLEQYQGYFPDERWSALRFYPLTEFMLRLAVAGAIIATPATLHEGMRQAMRLNAVAFASSLIGRVLLEVLDRNPVRLTEQAMAARRLSTNYGEWTIGARGPRSIEAIYRSEYVWLESAIAGAAVGTFEVCQIQAKIETQLKDRFNGSTLVSW